MKWTLALLASIAGTACTSDRVVGGRFVWGHEVQTFQPCGSKKTYWVKGEQKTLQPLRDRTEVLRRQRGKPYQPIYIEARGAIDTQSSREGFATAYDGVFHLREVGRLSNVVPEDCGK